ncbi:D-alanyl-D-alanine carboxypeptidase [Micrococcus sp.]|uniref:D-alanyl-D-alanine carboxypeptidase n=1 Tax=Micrococcus sp. TaxID=1271 RepID=UPI0026DADDFB|nr:D-alanyl-D-alanine carboxypeptidase [Micrococcus sp.]MDO4238843.1 D-alanyl-D-alanine carboxypeptidase [Micrococcus sp.]
MTARRPDRTLVVLCVLLALAVAALLALLTRDFLLPRLVAAPAAPPSAASSPTSPTTTALPSPTRPPSPSPSAETPGEVPTPAEVADAVEPGLAAAPGTVSAQFRDLATGRVLFSQDAEEPVAPASAVKILTGAAVLDALGSDATLPTRVVVLPAEDGEATELVLVGGGDVLLGTGASDPSRVDGRAGLRTLAERTLAGLAERGVTGPVVVSTDLRLFEDADPLNPAWSAGMVESGNIAAVQPLATYGGRATPGTGQDRVADPAASAARAFQAELDALADAAAEGDDGATASDPAPVEVSLREEVPPTRAARDEVWAAEPVAEVRSAPVGEQVAYLLAHSENQVAEALAHTAAATAGRPATHAGAAALLEAEAADLGVDPAGMDVVDASGLAAANRLSADQLVGVVTGLAADPARALVLDALPRPGEDSTLGERFPSPPARDAVAAKTGTLDQTVSLTGTVTTTSGRVLAFSVVCSGVDWQIAPARAAIDEAVAAVAAL